MKGDYMKKTVVGIVIAVVVIILLVGLFFVRANYVNGYIPDDYCARIASGAGEIMNCTYIYKNDDVLSYIQTEETTKSYGSSEWNRTIKKRDNFSNYLELYDITKANSSNGFVSENKLFSGENITVPEFIRKLTLDDQIDVVLNKEVSGDVDFAFGGGITIADLNDNGKLDIIVSRGMGGQGFCNNDVAVYEVNDALSDLVYLGNIGVDLTPSDSNISYCYKNGSRIYIANNYSRDGGEIYWLVDVGTIEKPEDIYDMMVEKKLIKASDNYKTIDQLASYGLITGETKVAFTVEDDKIENQPIAFSVTLLGNYDGESELSEIRMNYTDDGQELSDEEYENIAESLYEDYKKSNLRLNWLEINEAYDNTIGENVIYLNGRKIDEFSKETIKELIRNMCRNI